MVDDHHSHNEADSPNPDETQPPPPLETDSSVNSKLFREVYSQNLYVPDQLDILFKPVNTKQHFIWYILFFLSVFLVLWLFFGSIPILMTGKGIMLNREGLFSIQAKTPGIIEEILVKAGETVEAGQLIAKVYDPQEALKYQSSLFRIENLEKDIFKLNNQILTEAGAEKESLEKQILTNEETIKQLQFGIKTLEEELVLKENLLTQNLIGLQDLHETKQLLVQRKIALELAKGTIATLKANLAKNYREKELREKRLDLFQTQQQSDLIKLNIHYNNIFSPYAGQVLDILVSIGNKITAGSPLIQLEYHDKSKSQHLFYAYVPVEIGKKIQIGTLVSIELSTIRAEEYGALIGKVIEVSSYAVSRETIGSKIQNPGLVNYLIPAQEVLIQIAIEPIVDLNTPTGYNWTSGKGPNTVISTGTVGIVKGIVGRVRPIFYFFSLWRLEKFRYDAEEKTG